MLPHVQRVWDENFEVYGVRKVWRQMRRERFEVARCTVQRLMKRLGLEGVVRGKPVRTTVSDPKAACPPDHVNRQFTADRPNALWVSDFTYVSTWQGFVYVAFVIDVFARRIVGWKASSSARTDLRSSMHSSRRCMRAGRSARIDLSIIPTEACNPGSTGRSTVALVGRAYCPERESIATPILVCGEEIEGHGVNAPSAAVAHTSSGANRSARKRTQE